MEYVDPKYIESIYEKMESMQIDLDVDPRLRGIRILNSKIALARNYLTTCQNWYTTLSKSFWQLKRDLLLNEATLDMKVNNLLTLDPEVRAGKNATDKRAMALSKTSEEVVKINDLKISILDLSMAIEVLKAKIKDLMDVQNRIKDQYRLSLDEIKSSNLKWGDPEDKSREKEEFLEQVNNSLLNPEVEDPLSKLLLKEEEVVEPTKEALVPETKEEDSFDQLLMEIPEVTNEDLSKKMDKPQDEEINIDELLGIF
jgi:hypothetical protein